MTGPYGGEVTGGSGAAPGEVALRAEPLDLDEVAAPEIPTAQGFRLFFSRLLGWLRSVWPWVVLLAIGWLGWHELRQIDVSAVRALLRGTDVNLVLTLLGVTAVNLMIFGLYDVVALGPLSRPPAGSARWGVGVVSFAWSNFLTLGPLAGPALRLWLYRSLEVPAERARAALTSILAALSLALLTWCAAVSLPLPAGLDTLWTRLGLAVPLAALAVLALRRLPRQRLVPAAVRRWEGSPTRLVAVAVVDWLVAWGIFHLALHGMGAGIQARASLAAFFIGQLIGLVSFIPGGLGSADAYWLLALSDAAGGHDRVLAALLLYRLVYYVLPWAAATLVLAGRLVRTGPRTAAFVRTAIASYTVMCGAVLLASAATPSLAERTAFLRKTIPLPLVEISHGTSVVLGFLLLVISRGLARGYRSSHRLALALFLAAALTTFLKGLDFEEAILSLVAVAILLVAHQPFERAGRLQPPVEFILSVGLFAVVFFAAVGFGSLPARPEIPTVLGHFGYHAYAARFLRGLVLLASMVAVAALHFAFRPRVHDPLPGPDEIERALEEVRAYARNTSAMLVACGDKAIFRTAGDRSARRGRSAAFWPTSSTMPPPSIRTSSCTRSRRRSCRWRTTSASASSSWGRREPSTFCTSTSRGTRPRPGGTPSTASRRRADGSRSSRGRRCGRCCRSCAASRTTGSPTSTSWRSASRSAGSTRPTCSGFPAPSCGARRGAPSGSRTSWRGRAARSCRST